MKISCYVGISDRIRKVRLEVSPLGDWTFGSEEIMEVSPFVDSSDEKLISSVEISDGNREGKVEVSTNGE